MKNIVRIPILTAAVIFAAIGAATGAAMGAACAAYSGEAQRPPDTTAVQYSAAAALSSANEFIRALENSRFTMDVVPATGEFRVVDSRNGRTWYSNPQERDETASGFDMQLLRSRMILYANFYSPTAIRPVRTSYFDTASDTIVYYLLLDNAVIFVYDFQRAHIRIPVQYTLTDIGFAAEILHSEIDEYGPHELLEVRFLPSFGAGGPADSGYIVIPHGSGALINFNNNKTGAGKLENAVIYGFNAGTSDLTTNTTIQYQTTVTLGHAVNMPLWGMRINNDGFLAVIAGGSSRGSLNAQSGGQGSAYNLSYSGYNYRFQGRFRMLTKGFNQENITISEYDIDRNNNYRVEYNFLDTGSATYTDMARFYREHYLRLTKIDPAEDGADIPFYLDVYGFLVKTKPRLGIPMDTVIPLTAYRQVQSILDSLDTGGVRNINVRYNYWQRGGYYDRINSVRPFRVLGGASGLRSLNDHVTSLGGRLFLTHEPLNVYKPGRGFRSINHALKTVARTTQMQFQFSLENASIDTRYAPWYLVRPQKIGDFLDKFIDRFDKSLGHISLDSIGEMLYSELAHDGINRDDVMANIKEQLDKIDTLMINGAFDYAAARSKHVMNSPLRFGALDIYDAQIPFWQIVFAGYVDFSLGATNLSSNPSRMMLHMLETGASPMYSWVYQNNDELIGSRSDNLYSADFSRWLSKAIFEYNQVNEVLSKVRGMPITAHQRTGDTSMTEYGGRFRVYCDFAAGTFRVVEQ